MTQRDEQTSSGVPAIELNGLTRTFGTRTAVDSVNLTIPQGVAFGLLGPNGAGKTTLIRMIVGLLRPSGGSARVLGHDVTHELEAALADVGAIVEEPKFHPHLTGRENLEVVASLRSEHAWNAISESLVRVGLGGREDERVGGYSLGMRQRLGIARCLLTDPKLIILDEPMNGLDPPGIAEIRSLIRELVAEGKTVLISSHLLDEIERTCDDVAILSFGHVLAAGSLESILEGRVRSISLRTSDDDRALSTLVGLDGFRSVTRDQGGIRVDLGEGDGAHGADAVAAQIARELVTSGFDLYQLNVNAVTLEERFFEMTGTGAEAGE